MTFCIDKRLMVILVLVLALIFSALGATLTASADESSIPDSPDEIGPYKVGWYCVDYTHPDFGEYNALVFYPAKRDGWKACRDSSGGPYPGIVVSNGYMTPDWLITWVPKHLASHGYVSLVFTPPDIAKPNTTQWAQGFSLGIEKLKEQNSKCLAPIKGIVDTNTFGVIGLSMGGAGALQASANDPEIDAAVGLAAAYLTTLPFLEDFIEIDEDRLEILAEIMASVRDAIDEIEIPLQLQVGSGDGFVTKEGTELVYSLVPDTTTKEYVRINGADHVGYMDLWMCPFVQKIEEFLGGSISITFEEQHRIAAQYFTSWFNYYLKAKTEYYPYIYGDVAQSDLSNGVLTNLEYANP